MNLNGLIFPVIALVAPWVGAEEDDPDFHEPLLNSPGPDGGPGSPMSAHGPAYAVDCQVEPDMHTTTSMYSIGDAPVMDVVLLFARSPGNRPPLPQRRDLLLSLATSPGQVLRDFSDVGGLMAAECHPLSVAPFRGRAYPQLWRVTFQSRNCGVRRPA